MLSRLRNSIVNKIENLIRHTLHESLEEIHYINGVQLIRDNLSRKSKTRELADYSVKIFSQFGEDGIFEYLSESLNCVRPRFVEFGVGDFSECNSRFISRNRLAEVVLIDKNERLEAAVRNSQEARRTKIKTYNTWVTVENANNLFDLAREELGGIDFLSIDLDGNDYWILSSLNLQDLQVICVEFNPFFGRQPLSVEYNASFNRHSRNEFGDVYGASLGAFKGFLELNGFTLVGTNEVRTNAFFVANNLIGLIDIKIPKDSDLAKLTFTTTRDRLHASGKVDFVDYESRVSAIEKVTLINTMNGERVNIAGEPLSE